MAKISFIVDKALLARMEAEAERREFEGEPGDLAAFLVTYALNRIDVLATHAAKVRAVKAAKDAGKKIPKGIEFKRYVPTFADKALDAEGTEPEIATWTHKAPVATVRVLPKRLSAPKPATKAAPVKASDKVKANEARIAEIEAKLAKPAPAARPPVVRKAAPSTPAAKPGIKTARAEAYDLPCC